MKRILGIILFGGFSLTAWNQQGYQSDRLTQKWATPAVLKVPESVYYDHDRQIIYVSNVTGSPTDKDGTGFISRITADGNIDKLEWVTGLNAPKGMGITGGLLYVSDINSVVWIDIASGKVTGQLEIPGAQFLNDIATDKQGNVYVSDMNGNAIYLIRDGKVEVVVKSDKITGVNGLYVNEGNLYAGLQDRVVSINLKTKEVKDYILNTGGIDGLVPDGQGNYLISDWLGSVHLINPSKDKALLLNTAPVNAADIDYIIAKHLLLVPTFSDNRVVAYELK
jgi:hypothetical protein